jgi:hypothetical protein
VVRWLLKLWRLGKMACAWVCRVLRGGQRVLGLAEGGLRVEDPVGRDEHVRGKLVALRGEPYANPQLDPSPPIKEGPTSSGNLERQPAQPRAGDQHPHVAPVPRSAKPRTKGKTPAYRSSAGMCAKCASSASRHGV